MFSDGVPWVLLFGLRLAYEAMPSEMSVVLCMGMCMPVMDQLASSLSTDPTFPEAGMGKE